MVTLVLKNNVLMDILIRKGNKGVVTDICPHVQAQTLFSSFCPVLPSWPHLPHLTRKEKPTHDTFIFFLSASCLSKRSSCPKQGHLPTYIPTFSNIWQRGFSLVLGYPCLSHQGTTKSLILSYLHLNIVLGRPSQGKRHTKSPVLSSLLPALAAVLVVAHSLDISLFGELSSV